MEQFTRRGPSSHSIIPLPLRWVPDGREKKTTREFNGLRGLEKAALAIRGAAPTFLVPGRCL